MRRSRFEGVDRAAEMARSTPKFVQGQWRRSSATSHLAPARMLHYCERTQRDADSPVIPWPRIGNRERGSDEVRPVSLERNHGGAPGSALPVGSAGGNANRRGGVGV